MYIVYGRLRQENPLRSGVQDQPRQHNETLHLLITTKTLGGGGFRVFVALFFVVWGTKPRPLQMPITELHPGLLANFFFICCCCSAHAHVRGRARAHTHNTRTCIHTHTCGGLRITLWSCFFFFLPWCGFQRPNSGCQACAASTFAPLPTKIFF